VAGQEDVGRYLRQRIQRAERLGRVAVEARRHDLGAVPAGEGVVGRQDVAGQQDPPPLKQQCGAPRGVPGRVHHPGRPRQLERLAVAEGRHLLDGDQPGGAPAGEREQGPVELDPQQVAAGLAVVLPGLGALDHRGVGLVDPDRDGGGAAGPFGEAGVVAVGVGDQHGVQVLEPPAEGRQGPDQQVPVAGRPGVDQEEPSPLLDQVEVADAPGHPVHAVGHLHLFLPTLAASGRLAW
jgi:hypothetical protein